MSVIKKLSYSCIQLEVKQKVRIVRFQTKKLNVYTCTHRVCISWLTKGKQVLQPLSMLRDKLEKNN